METTIVIGPNQMEKKMENEMEAGGIWGFFVYWGYIGIMEKKMETTVVYWGCIGIMAKKMETTIIYWGYFGIMENGMQTNYNGSYNGLYRV